MLLAFVDQIIVSIQAAFNQLVGTRTTSLCSKQVFTLSEDVAPTKEGMFYFVCMRDLNSTIVSHRVFFSIKCLLSMLN